MREVILTVGPRGAGKSFFCKKALALDPSIIMVSRDEIHLALFGKTSLCPYEGGHFLAEEKMLEAMRKALIPNDVRIVLDAWNGRRAERQRIIKMLRGMEVDRVVAWYFVTSVEKVEEWFWQKLDVAKLGFAQGAREKGKIMYLEDAPRRDHERFHELASDIDSDGFDEIVRIDPVCMDPERVIQQRSPK